MTQLQSRYSCNGSGLKEYLFLESALLVKDDFSVFEKYPEIDVERLKIQLPMFKLQYNHCCTINDVIVSVRTMVPEVKEIFSEVVAVARLMLVFPVSSCESERSFSALRRLKTWLRTTMSQQRLNSSSVCHVHKHMLDEVDLVSVAREFVSKNTIRKNLFGHI